MYIDLDLSSDLFTKKERTTTHHHHHIIINNNINNTTPPPAQQQQQQQQQVRLTVAMCNRKRSEWGEREIISLGGGMGGRGVSR